MCKNCGERIRYEAFFGDDTATCKCGAKYRINYGEPNQQGWIKTWLTPIEGGKCQEESST